MCTDVGTLPVGVEKSWLMVDWGRPFWIMKYLVSALGAKLPKGLADWLSKPERLSRLQGKSWDPFPPVKLAEKLEDGVKVLLLHGETDSTVPVTHSRV